MRGADCDGEGGGNGTKVEDVDLGCGNGGEVEEVDRCGGSFAPSLVLTGELGENGSNGVGEAVAC